MDSVPDEKKNEIFANLTNALVSRTFPSTQSKTPIQNHSSKNRPRRASIGIHSTTNIFGRRNEGREYNQGFILRAHGKDSYLIFDECTEVLVGYVVALLVVILDTHNQSKPILFEVVEIERTTSVAIRVEKTINTLFSSVVGNAFTGIQRDII